MNDHAQQVISYNSDDDDDPPHQVISNNDDEDDDVAEQVELPRQWLRRWHCQVV